MANDNFALQFNEKMLAYCGLYCEQCSFKVAHDEGDKKHLENTPYKHTDKDLSEYACECCKGDSICGPCEIKDCAEERHVVSCADCVEFPCERIDSFANDGIPHHGEAKENLKAIRKEGMSDWFNNLKPKLKCHCGERQSWYYTCSHQEQ